MYNIKRKINQSDIESIDKIIDGMEQLLVDWKDELNDEYPFSSSLDEVLTSVIKWKKAQIEKDKK